MPNLLDGEDPEKLNGDPFELLSSLAFEQPTLSRPHAPLSSTAVLCTGSWDMPATKSTSTGTLDEETPSQSSEASEIHKDEPDESSSRRTNMTSKAPRSSRFSLLGAVSVRSSQRAPRQKGSSYLITASDRQLDGNVPVPVPVPPTQPPMDDDADDDDEEEVIPGAEAVARGSATLRPLPAVRKASSASSGKQQRNVSERPVRISMSGTEMFTELSDELVEAEPVKTEEELMTEIRIDTEKKYEGNARRSKLLVAEEIDLESAEDSRKQRRFKEMESRCFTSLCYCFFFIPVLIVVILTVKRNISDDTVLTTDNPTASPTFTEVVTPFTCEEAAPLNGNSSIVGSTRGAPSPGDVPLCSGLASNGFGAWFEFVGDGNVVNCTTCDPNTNFDTQLSVFTGSCSKLQCIAANDQGSSESCGSQSKVEFSTNPGETYFIFVHGKREAEGQVVLSLNPVMQDNDSCGSAGPVLPSGLSEIIGNTWFAATSKTADNFTCSESTVPGLWYAMDGKDENMTISTCSETTKYDGGITVATGGSCNGLTCVSTTSEDCISPFRGAIKTFFGNAGTTYYVKIHGSEAARAAALSSRRLQDGASPADGQFGMVARDEVGASGFFVNRQEACEASQDVEIDGEPTTGTLYQTSNLLWDSFCEGDGQGEYLRVTGTGLNLTANTCNDDTAIDTTLAVLTGDCLNQQMECIASNDQFCGDQSSVTWFAEEGVTYYLLVRSVGAIQGKYTVSLSSLVDIIDPIQQCESARIRDVLGGSIAASLIGGQPFRYEPKLAGSCGTSSYDKSPATWFKLDDTRAGTKLLLSAEDCYNTAPLELTVFSGSCDELICVAGSSDFCNENVEWEWENGLPYYLMFHGPDSIGATFIFSADTVIS
ncbi:unnamed protein product [Cylindrotheca closterium]|uniref:Uncharacterized protein n=1 Tax=Cylindrotheca closterium TaxID=2856 RepID=A0AAD2JLW2_9STRA|nr:unnamed protein product [Cylindrotheca closterium]